MPSNHLNSDASWPEIEYQLSNKEVKVTLRFIICGLVFSDYSFGHDSDSSNSESFIEFDQSKSSEGSETEESEEAYEESSWFKKLHEKDVFLEMIRLDTSSSEEIVSSSEDSVNSSDSNSDSEEEPAHSFRRIISPYRGKECILPPKAFQVVLKHLSLSQLKVMKMVSKYWCAEIDSYLDDHLWLRCTHIVSKNDIFHLNKSEKTFKKVWVEKDCRNLSHILSIIDLKQINALNIEKDTHLGKDAISKITELQYLEIYDFTEFKALVCHFFPKLKVVVFKSNEVIPNIGLLEAFIQNHPQLEELELSLPHTKLGLFFLRRLTMLRRFTLKQFQWNNRLLNLNRELNYLSLHLTRNSISIQKQTEFLSKFHVLQEFSFNFLTRTTFLELWLKENITKVKLVQISNPSYFWDAEHRYKSNLTSLTFSCLSCPESFMHSIVSSLPSLRNLAVACEKKSILSLDVFL